MEMTANDPFEEISSTEPEYTPLTLTITYVAADVEEDEEDE